MTESRLQRQNEGSGARCLLVTGVDSRLFCNCCMLFESLQYHHPGLPLCVCDFGLTVRQRRFVEQLGVLLPRPDALQGYSDPWYLKGSLAAYVGERSWDTLVWLDADMIAVTPVLAAVEEIATELRQQKRDVACCCDAAGMSLDDFLRFGRSQSLSVGPFARQLHEASVDLGCAYLNTGFVVIISPDLLARWQALTLRQERHFLFEQNAFNLLVRVDGLEPHLLPAAQWNVHNELLASVTLGDDPPVRLIHATSAGSRHHSWEELSLEVDGRFWRTRVKWFTRESFQRLQMGYLEGFLSRHREALLSCEVIR